MNSGATPGEWLVQGTTVYALHGNPPRNRFSAHVQSGRRDDASEEERVAIANLMAAAPDLLSELQKAHAIIRNALNLMTSEQKQAWARLNAMSVALGDDDGTTRAHDREAVIVKATGSPA